MSDPSKAEIELRDRMHEAIKEHNPAFFARVDGSIECWPEVERVYGPVERRGDVTPEFADRVISMIVERGRTE